MQHPYHPWRALRALAGWTLHWHDLGDPDVLGRTDYDQRTVTLSPGMTQAQRRSTIAHEVAHVERGPVPGHMQAREEEAADATAAERLITAAALIEAARWARSVHELADELWVDEDTVECRLRNLTTDELTQLMEVWRDDARAHGH